MASRTTSRSITLRVGQDEKIREWHQEKFFQISGYFQDCIEILEKRPELLDTVRPGLELSRALDRAERFQDASKLLDDIHTEACHAIAEGSSLSCVLVQKWVEDLYLKWESNDAKLMGDVAPSSGGDDVSSSEN